MRCLPSLPGKSRHWPGCETALSMNLVIEIISPSNPRKDRELKRTVYARYGVREYWIVDPDSKSIEVLIRQEGDLKLHQTFVADDWLTSPLLEGFRLSLPVVFRF